MKKIITLLGAVATLGLAGCSKTSSSVDFSALQEDKTTTFIVEVDDNLDSKTNVKARNRALSDVKFKLTGFDYSVPYVYDRVLNGFAITVNSKQASLCEAVLKSSNYVSNVTEETRYSMPSGDSGTTTTYINGEATTTEDKSTSAEKTAYSNREYILKNVSASDMGATNDQIKAVTGKDAALGKGVTIGIIDTGLILNQVSEVEDEDGNLVANSYRTTAEENMKSKGLGSYINSAAFRPFTADDNWTDTLSKEKIESVKTSLTGSKYRRLNNKIPFSYDYVGNDNNVNPDPEEGNHGTHVAGLAAANGKDFQGVSKNAQLAIFKVFGDKATGAGDAAIAAALNDAATLGLDMVNLSLGSPLDESKSSSGSAAIKALSNCSKAGTIVNFSAGNDGKGSFASTKGYSQWSTDTVESGILGSYAADSTLANIIASSNPTQKFYTSLIQVGDQVVQFENQMVNKSGSSTSYSTEYPFAETIENNGNDTVNYPNLKNADGSYNYIYVKDHGKSSAYDKDASGAIDSKYKGKIVVCDRGGSVTFESMAQSAAAAEAAALIVINNTTETTFSLSMSFGNFTPNFPVIFVLSSGGDILKSALTNNAGKMNIVSNRVADTADGNGISSYSSDGTTSDLSISPTISAPGYQVISSISADVNGTKSGSTRIYNSNLYGYEYMQGTSMASPNLTGAMAAALSEYVPGSGSKAVADDEAYAKKKKELSSIMMSTADSNIGTNKKSESIRRQGAGEINTSRILAADSYVTSSLNNDDTLVKSKAELKNADSLEDGGTLYHADLSKDEAAYINIPYEIHNTSSTAKQYTPSLKLLIPSLDVQYTAQDAYDAYYNKDTTNTETMADNLTGNITTSIYDDEVTVPESAYASDVTSVSVAANSTVTGIIKVRIDNLQFSKSFDNSDITEDSEKHSTSDYEKYKTEDFNGTLREYFNKYFSSTKGSYVEGFVTFTDSDSTTAGTAKDTSMNMPFLGFYGDYTAGAAVEPFQFEKEDNHLYNSSMIDAYLKNLNATYKKENAYVGSTLAGHAGAVKSSVINNILNFNTAGLSSVNGEFTDVIDTSTGTDRIVAGGEAGSDHLFATFFVLRNVSSATWTIKNTDGNTVKTGKVTNKWLYGGSTLLESDSLLKSWLIIDSSVMNASRAVADIDLSDISDGDYTLSFTFNLTATDNEGNEGVQTKSYPLLIDKVAPTIKNLSYTKENDEGYINITTDSNANITSTDGTGGWTDTSNYTKVYVFGDSLEKTSYYMSVQDAAGNRNGLLLDLTDTSIFVFGKGLSENYHIEKTEINYETGMWNVEILDAKGNLVTPTGDSYKIYSYVGKGLTDLVVSEIGGSTEIVSDPNIYTSTTAGHYYYDSETGYLIMNVAAGETTFTCNYLPIAQDGTPTKASFNPTPTPTPTPTPDKSNTSANTSTNTSTSDDKNDKKSGCGGTIIGTTSALGALALTSLALALKKKKEDK